VPSRSSSLLKCDIPAWHSANVSDFRKAGLKRQVLNFGALDPDVAICRFMQLYEGHSPLFIRESRPSTDTLRKRAGAIDMFLSNERGLDVPCDIGHSRLLTRSIRCLSSFLRKCQGWPFRTKCKIPLSFWLQAKSTLIGCDMLGDAHKFEDVYDDYRKPTVFLVLCAGRRARAWIHAIVHARYGVRTAGNVGWHNLGNRLFDLSQKAETYSSALQANIVLIHEHSSNQLPAGTKNRSSHAGGSGNMDDSLGRSGTFRWQTSGTLGATPSIPLRADRLQPRRVAHFSPFG
jgi:hypothetical protein